MVKTKRDDSYSHILKYTGLFGGVQGLGIVVGLVRNKLVAMILGPDGMGLISLFNSTIKLVSDSTNFGIGMSAVKNISAEYDSGDCHRIRHSIKLIRSWSLLAAILGMFVCIVLSPLLNKWTFTWGDHTLHFVLLSPVVGLMAITAGEMAILKGTRQLRHLASISIYNVVGVLVTSVPIYYFFGEAGIVPSLVIGALIQMLLTIGYSYRMFKPQLSFSKPLLGEGMGMVRLGVAFVVAGILGSGAEFLIRSFLNTNGSLEIVGLYNAGYMMTITYAGMVFSAMETDYFPRLSSIRGTGKEMNRVVNNQIEVSLLMVSPLLVAFMISQPILLPLLYTGKFLPAMGMIQITILSMYLRAVKLPIAYIPLARGDSRSYLLMEGIYDVALVLVLMACFREWGLTGAGIAITAAAVFDFVMLCLYMRWKYGYCLSRRAVRYCMMQLPLGILAFLVTFVHQPFLYWLMGTLLFVVSLMISINVFKSKTHLMETLRNKFSHR